MSTKTVNGDLLLYLFSLTAGLPLGRCCLAAAPRCCSVSLLFLRPLSLSHTWFILTTSLTLCSGSKESNEQNKEKLRVLKEKSELVDSAFMSAAQALGSRAGDASIIAGLITQVSLSAGHKATPLTV